MCIYIYTYIYSIIHTYTCVYSCIILYILCVYIYIGRGLVGHVRSRHVRSGWPLPFPYLIKAGTSSAASMVLASGHQSLEIPPFTEFTSMLFPYIHAKWVPGLSSRAWLPKGKNVQSSVCFHGWIAHPASCFESVRQVHIWMLGKTDLE